MNKENKIASWLFNPFKYIAGTKALIGGIIAMAIISVFGYLSNTHFDGVLDIHYGCATISTPYIIHAMYQIIGWVSITVVFYITARIATKSDIRFIDIAGTLAFSQIPLIFAALTGFLPGIHLCFDNLDAMNINDMLLMLKDNIGMLIISGTICILFIIWSIILKYKAYSTSANIKGVVGGATFALALIISEVVSKLLMYFILPLFY